MDLCFYCGRSLGTGRHPPEHVLPAALGATVVTDKVCADCNRRAGSEVDGPFQKWPLIMELRHRFGIRDRDGKPPRPVTWTGSLTADPSQRAAVDVKQQRVDVRVLPSERDEAGMRIYAGDTDDVVKRTGRIRRDQPDAKIVDLPANTFRRPLSAQVTWEMSVHVWPRFAAKVVLSAASLLVEQSWAGSDEAAELRRVLWRGDESTVEHEMLPPGRAWSLAPFDLTGRTHALRPPEHLIMIERWEERSWIVLIVLGTFMYGVPVSFPLPDGDRASVWLMDPIARRHVALTRHAWDVECARRIAH